MNYDEDDNINKFKSIISLKLFKNINIIFIK